MEVQASITEEEITVRVTGYKSSIHRLLHPVFLWGSTAMQVALVVSSCDLGFGSERNAGGGGGAPGLPMPGQDTWQLIPKHWYPVGPAFCTIRHCVCFQETLSPLTHHTSSYI
jgi:hypothetical protein